MCPKYTIAAGWLGRERQDSLASGADGLCSFDRIQRIHRSPPGTRLMRIVVKNSLVILPRREVLRFARRTANDHEIEES